MVESAISEIKTYLSNSYRAVSGGVRWGAQQQVDRYEWRYVSCELLAAFPRVDALQ